MKYKIMVMRVVAIVYDSEQSRYQYGPGNGSLVHGPELDELRCSGWNKDGMDERIG